LKLLAVDTSTPACSAALYIDGVIEESFVLAPKEHTKLILPMVDKLLSVAGLRPQQLTALAFGRGPGSFTGVRIATGVIQGIALGADLPIVPVSTLAALAQDYFDNSFVNVAFTAMDARMGEIFWSVYGRDGQGLAQLVEAETVTPASQVNFPQTPGGAIGSGWTTYSTELEHRLMGLIVERQAEVLPRARAIARLGVAGFACGDAVPAEQAMPVYLRDKVAKKESER
jgi:tRNA threonylcarbamoyladenosine biosynthesis protein TsaB